MRQKYSIDNLHFGKRRLFFTRIFDIDLLIYPQKICWSNLWLKPKIFWADVGFYCTFFCQGIGCILLMILESIIYACSPTVYYRLLIKKQAPQVMPLPRAVRISFEPKSRLDT